MTEPRPTAESSESEIVDFIRSSDVRAPDSLHRQVESLIANRSPRSARRPHGARERSAAAPFGAGRSRIGPRLAAGGAIAAALIALAVAVGLNDGGSSTLSVHDASALALRPATAAAPAESNANHRALAAAVDGVAFPYWEERFGWRSTGARTDHIDGHTVTTIFYGDSHGRRIGYAIIAGRAPSQGSGGVVAWREGTQYRLLTQNGRPVVSWLRDGHLCVVSGHGVDGATLLRLASWDDRRSVAA
jgi:hypothetical protein